MNLTSTKTPLPVKAFVWPRRFLPGRRALLFLSVCIFIVSSAFAGLSPFPLTAKQRGTVSCLENRTFLYEIYLPPAYSTNGTALPIIYTANAGGNGMVGSFLTTCSNLNIIVVGLIQSKNGTPWDTVLREIYAVTRDVRQRVLFDPTAEFAGGFSGGGLCSYMFSRIRSQHVSGVLEMAGWLGRINLGTTVSYYDIDRVQTNLLVARISGTSDSGAFFYNAFDGAYLATCGAVIQDWTFNGGHGVPPASNLAASLSWLVSQRTPSGPNDLSEAVAQANDWQTRITNGQQEFVLRECVSNLVTHPRSWFAYHAQLTLDQLMTNYTSFRTLNVSNLAQGDFISDLFYHYARGAALNGDWSRYNSSMKIMTGITVPNDFEGTLVVSNINIPVITPTNNGMIYITLTNNDRAGDFYSLLTNYNHYPSPQIQSSLAQGGLNLRLCKDTPGLAYSIQSRLDLVNDAWQNLPVTATDTDTTWSENIDLPSEPASGYFRIEASPVPATSPPWTSR